MIHSALLATMIRKDFHDSYFAVESSEPEKDNESGIKMSHNK